VTVGRGGGAVSTNTVVGNNALAGVNTGTGFNNAFGQSALASNTSGALNNAFGYATLASNLTGLNNCAFGHGALYVNTASNNTAFGHNTLIANTSGASNVAVGVQALNANTTASNNTAVGYQAGYLSTGAGNQFFGYSSGSAVTSGAKNVILGSYTGSAAPISATGSNYIVLSDGDANIVASTKTAQTFALQGGTLSAGTGIAFPATQSASTDANTLDDYEEGTFTPTLGGTTVHATQVGNYVKVGKAVTVQIYIAITTIGTGSTTTISGLPFTSPTQQAAFSSYWGSLATAATTLKPRFEAGTTISFYGASSANATTGSWTTFGNSTALYVSGTYFI
jgi:hypothetical protein